MSRLVPLSMAIVSSSLMGCILPVTPDFEVPPNTPARVLGTEATPQNEILVVDLETFTGTALTIDVKVEDPDVLQELRYLVYVNFDESPTRPQPNSEMILPISPVPDSANPEERFVTVSLPITELTRGFEPRTGCRSVQVRVNEEYGLGEDLRPIPLPTEAEEGFGTWLVALTDRDDPFVDVTECPSSVATEEM